jgi:hypothetical protein
VIDRFTLTCSNPINVGNAALAVIYNSFSLSSHIRIIFVILATLTSFYSLTALWLTVSPTNINQLGLFLDVRNLVGGLILRLEHCVGLVLDFSWTQISISLKFVMICLRLNLR